MTERNQGRGRRRNFAKANSSANTTNPDAAEWTIGIHAVVELLKQNPTGIQRLMLLQGRDDDRHNRIRELAQKARLPIEDCQRHEFSRVTDGVHQGVAALSQMTDPTKKEAFLSTLLNDIDHPPFFLVLDGITDPHNLGAAYVQLTPQELMQ